MTTAMRHRDGFGLGYRIRWWIEYGLMHVLGPAQLDEARDPRARMRREYARRKAAHERQQTKPSDGPTAE